jgi:hypothetical protein
MAPGNDGGVKELRCSIADVNYYPEPQERVREGGREGFRVSAFQFRVLLPNFRCATDTRAARLSARVKSQVRGEKLRNGAQVLSLPGS